MSSHHEGAETIQRTQGIKQQSRVTCSGYKLLKRCCCSASVAPVLLSLVVYAVGWSNDDLVTVLGGAKKHLVNKISGKFGS